MYVTFRFKSVTKQYVLTAIGGLKDSKSTGPDIVLAKILAFSPSVKESFNRSYQRSS